MKNMKTETWLLCWLILVVSALFVFGRWVYVTDPYFHYHAPDTDRYLYPLNYQRGQNDGIIRHFEYDAVITGTSMTENFRTTEAEKLFGYRFIKIPFAGASYKEINDNLKTALKADPGLKLVIRALDMGKFMDAWDAMRYDPSEYPDYLYDSDPLNDVKYLLNREVVFGRSWPMMESAAAGGRAGITSFDRYSSWHDAFTFGIGTVAPDGFSAPHPAQEAHLTEEDKARIEKNIRLNVTDLADEYPDTEFYYFYPPYSISAWHAWADSGLVCQTLEAEEYITQLILPHKNIHLFSFNGRTDITTDLNNYTNNTHYGYWINSLMLRWMRDGEYLLTEENYKDRLKEEYDFYTSFDYESLNGQTDYEADLRAAALLNRELTGAQPLDVLAGGGPAVELMNAGYITEDGRTTGIDCRGCLQRGSDEGTVADYLINVAYIGARFTVDLDDGYRYLSFCGQKIDKAGRPTVCVYDENGVLLKKLEYSHKSIDKEKHQYILDLSAVSGTVTVILNGGYVNSSGNADSEYIFSDIVLY